MGRSGALRSAGVSSAGPLFAVAVAPVVDVFGGGAGTDDARDPSAIVGALVIGVRCGPTAIDTLAGKDRVSRSAARISRAPA